ncbi:glutathione S-transferase family protein [Marinobacterium sp. D7]|uniref:glutathione S-transferase family protein n=1 Tax=Marinobacterium ramblicola TaxID=2849041 RepID=UPI001C2DA73F|nr:glutathione S-transferase family protein [Marinobacterium ramblicola]MBV1787506.1 glutathione S-transferase family protein [Marinobacterium ramblicola]
MNIAASPRPAPAIHRVSHLHLISHKLCPYVQRSVITLIEKGVPYARTDIDLAAKPEWFREISPTGKVPLLQIDNRHTLFESAVICEYLDETTETPLLPQDPLERARHRAWIEFGSAILNQIARLYSVNDETGFDDVRTTLRESFQRLEPVVVTPYFTGTEFGLVDAVFGPIFRYFDVFESVTDLGIFDGLPNVRYWRQSLRERESVRQAVGADYPQTLIAFVEARNSWLARLLQAKSRSPAQPLSAAVHNNHPAP